MASSQTATPPSLIHAPDIKAARWVSATATDLSTGDAGAFSRVASTGFTATGAEHTRLSVIQVVSSATRVDIADVLHLLRPVAGTARIP